MCCSQKASGGVHDPYQKPGCIKVMGEGVSPANLSHHRTLPHNPTPPRHTPDLTTRLHTTPHAAIRTIPCHAMTHSVSHLDSIISQVTMTLPIPQNNGRVATGAPSEARGAIGLPKQWRSATGAPAEGICRLSPFAELHCHPHMTLTRETVPTTLRPPS
jgi:hypothetical protein